MLRKFWLWLVGGCDHTWEDHSHFKTIKTYTGGAKYDYIEYHMRCSKCGIMRKQVL